MDNPQAKQQKILVVDDNPKNIQVIANILTNAHYSVGYATDGYLAINTLENANDYDLVLMDIDMPVMNGLEACRQIRKNEKLLNIPVIFLTAFTDTEKILSGFEAGAQDYVTKPFNSQELLARVKTHVELKKSREILLDINTYLEEQVVRRTQELSIANEKLDKANAQLEQLDQAKTEFIHLLSHEIRTPLNGVIGSLSLIKQNQHTDINDNLLNILDRSVKRLEDFSYQTLDISTLRTKSAKALLISKVDIKSILIECYKGFIDEANNKNIQFKFDYLSSDNEINGDEKHVSKSISIALGNAVKHSPLNKSIAIKLERIDKSLILFIQNQGKGFSEDMIGKPFSPFSTGKYHVNQNVGLDLYFVDLVMKAHNGSIEIGNSSDGGAFVKLTFNAAG